MRKIGSILTIIIGFIFVVIAVSYTNAWAKWPFETNGTIIIPSAVVADLDKDGELEVLIGSNDHYLYCVDKNGNLIWKYGPTNTGISSSAAVADLDGDGGLEILVGTGDPVTLNPGLYCIDKNGLLKWKYTGAWFYSSPAVADLDGNGSPEVLVGSQPDNSLLCLNKNGQLIWKFQTGRFIYSSPAVVDLNSDGELEVLVGSGDGNLYCIDKNGQLIWKYRCGETIFSSPAVADINSDGNLEVLVGSSIAGAPGCSDCGLYCIDKNGQLLWKYNTGAFVDSSPAVGDLNGDGNLEVLVTTWNGVLHCVNKDGGLVWGYGLGSNTTCSPAIADIDGDGNLEVLAGSGNGNLYCLNKNGQLKWNYPAFGRADLPPAVADLDGDGNLEILFGSHDGKLYCLNKDGKTFVPVQTQGKIDPLAWPMFHHDLQRTGLYDQTPPTTPVVTDEGSFINSIDKLYASWVSEEKQSGIRKYEYRITEGSTAGIVIRNWTSTGVFNYVTAGGLNLSEGRTYYFSVRAQNGAGLWSDIGYSDGITIRNLKPLAFIDSITPNPAYLGERVTLIGHGKDEDGNIVGYNWKSSINGELGNKSTLITFAFSAGTHIISFKVKDNNGAWSDAASATLVVKKYTATLQGKVYEMRYKGGLSYEYIPLYDAKVTVYQKDFMKSVMTDYQGNYKIEGIPVGSYTIFVSKLGYNPKVVAVSLAKDEIKKLDFYLQKLNPY